MSEKLFSGPSLERRRSPEEPSLSDRYGALLERIKGKLAPQDARDFAMLNSEQANHERMLLSDGLTGLLNRHGFYEEVQRMEAIFARERHDTKSEVISTLLAIDLDGFKEVNDSCGHKCGDRCLELIADHVKSALRESDVFARVGGDEFSIFLPQDDDVGAKLVAEKVRAVIEDEVVTKLRAEFPGYIGKLSASIGIVTIGREGDGKSLMTAEEAMKYADYAAYVVKASGKKGELTLAEARKLDEGGAFERDFLSGKTLPR
ncbi:MAG: GGDEF domain-containing protein [Minisyncoccia bacterium]